MPVGAAVPLVAMRTGSVLSMWSASFVQPALFASPMLRHNAHPRRDRIRNFPQVRQGLYPAAPGRTSGVCLEILASQRRQSPEF